MAKTKAKRSSSVSLVSLVNRSPLFIGIGLVITSALLLVLPSFFPKNFKITDVSLKSIESLQLSDTTTKRLASLKGVRVSGEDEFLSVVSATMGNEKLTEGQRQTILAASRDTLLSVAFYVAAILYTLIR